MERTADENPISHGNNITFNLTFMVIVVVVFIHENMHKLHALTFSKIFKRYKHQ